MHLPKYTNNNNKNTVNDNGEQELDNDTNVQNDSAEPPEAEAEAASTEQTTTSPDPQQPLPSKKTTPFLRYASKFNIPMEEIHQASINAVNNAEYNRFMRALIYGITNWL